MVGRGFSKPQVNVRFISLLLKGTYSNYYNMVYKIIF